MGHSPFSCFLHSQTPLTAKESFYSERAHRETYATILHSAHVYVCGAIAAAQSIPPNLNPCRCGKPFAPGNSPNRSGN
ncbi:hypothetical protein COP2_029523 [Malus domestica]